MQLALAGVNARSNLEVELAEAADDRPRAGDGSSRAVEDREETVARRVQLPTAKPRQLAPDDGVVVAEEVSPGAVTHLCCSLGRADDVREHDRRQHGVWHRRGLPARQERFDFSGHWCEGGEALLFDLEGVRALDSPGEVEHLVAILRAVEDERRHSDRRQHLA